MKTSNNTPLPRPRGGRIRAPSLATWLAGFALAALALSPPTLLGAVIDDFNGAEPGWDAWNAPAAPSEPAALAGFLNHRLRLVANFTTATDPANPMAHSCNVYYSTDLPVRPGQTLELRGDLVTGNLLNRFACLRTTDTKGGEYMLMWDKDEVALLKWSPSDGFSVAFWETHSGAYLDVVLMLALTPESEDLRIQTTVSKTTGETLFQRTVRDTPASDWGVPDPLPHGWQVFGPDVGPPYKEDLKGVGLGMLHDTNGQQGSVSVFFDNLEYRIVVPTDRYVIDDFEHGRKFLTENLAEWSIAAGELSLTSKPTNYAGVLYIRTYELAEGQPVEFSLDVLSVNSSSVWTGLRLDWVCPLLPNYGDALRGYSLTVLQGRVVLHKYWHGNSWAFYDTGMPSTTDPITMKLTLTRDGSSLRLGAKVVRRDDPQQVLFQRETLDTQGADSMVEGTDPGPPPSGPVTLLPIFWGDLSGPVPATVVLDNLICSQDQAPAVLGIHRDGATAATLVWPGWNVALESDSPQGPWRPCPEPVALGVDEYTSTVRLSDSARYFRLVRGFPATDSFNGGSSAWEIASVVPGGALKPLWSVIPAKSQGRIIGQGTRNADFVLGHNGAIEYRDCVSTLDIVDWGDAMADATFGILLRVKPAGDQWFYTTDGLPDQRYAGLLTFKKADNPTESALSITGPAGAVLKEERFPAVNPDKQYRLRFWAVGDQLTIELFDLEQLDTPIRAFTVTDGRIPAGKNGLCGTKSAGGTYEVWIDQYLFNGATVY